MTETLNTKHINKASVVIRRPHITEKATKDQENGVYVFIVSRSCNKHEIQDAIEYLYKVRPKKIRIINVPEKAVSSRGRSGVKSGFKKAVVYLKDGDKIDVT